MGNLRSKRKNLDKTDVEIETDSGRIQEKDVHSEVQDEIIEGEKQEDQRIEDLIDLTASGEQCKRVQTSFGIFTVLLPFLTTLEAIQMQLSSKFFYNSAIGRA